MASSFVLVLAVVQFLKSIIGMCSSPVKYMYSTVLYNAGLSREEKSLVSLNSISTVQCFLPNNPS